MDRKQLSNLRSMGITPKALVLLAVDSALTAARQAFDRVAFDDEPTTPTATASQNLAAAGLDVPATPSADFELTPAEPKRRKPLPRDPANPHRRLRPEETAHAPAMPAVTEEPETAALVEPNADKRFWPIVVPGSPVPNTAPGVLFKDEDAGKARVAGTTQAIDLPAPANPAVAEEPASDDDMAF